MKYYIGYDDRERDACAVAVKSLQRVSPQADITLLDLEQLAAQGLLRRPVDKRGAMYDFLSNANASTDFAISRFLVPILCQQGWALFTDCDVVFLEDPRVLLTQLNHSKAVYVVKHRYIPKEGVKMDGQVQTTYSKKNWSSVMLFNCDHPAHRRLSLVDVNERRGLDLHQFYWLHESEIGDLPPEWNWLVGVQERPESPKIAHFTLGGPWLPSWQQQPYDELWWEASR